MKPRTPPLVIALAGLAALGALGAENGCDPVDAYIFTARRYDADGGCTHYSTAIEQVSGPGADANCRARCLRVNGALFVSTICPPLPTSAVAVEPADPECAAALAVATITCGEPTDGGEPEPEDDDAGPAPADAGSD